MTCEVASRGMFARLFHAETRPSRLPAICQDLAQCLDMSARPRSPEELRCCLRTVAALLDGAKSTASEKNSLLSGLLDSNMPLKMIRVLSQLEFEAAKDCMRLFNQILKLGTLPVVDYIRSHKQILQMLFEGCGNAEVSLHSNNMLRSCTQHARLVELLLEVGFPAGLIKLAQHEDFDISSDAFCSLRQLLTTCKPVIAEYIIDHRDTFFAEYHKLLLSEDYFTKRQALGLLVEMLQDPCFAQVIPSYAGNDKFLRIHMNLLRDSSKTIQSDAFCVFSIFLADPQASTRVHQILHKNKDRLVKLLSSMGEQSDEDFAQVYVAAVDALQALAPPSRATSTRSSPKSKEILCPMVPAFEDLPASSQTSLEQVSLNDFAFPFIQWQWVS